MTYQTQPGTLPHRVVEYLKARPDEEIGTGVLCDELDADRGSFVNMMASAKKNGVVKARKIPARGVSMFWSLGDGTPDLPADFEPNQPLPCRGKNAPTPPPAQLFPGLVASVQQQFRAALWTDGSLILVGAQVRDDGTVILGARETAQVKRLISWSQAA